MCTDKYLKIVHHASLEDFLKTQENRELVAIENNTERAKPLHEKQFKKDTTLILGSENNGITEELLNNANDVRFIESFGSTRSVNVGAAAAIAICLLFSLILNFPSPKPQKEPPANTGVSQSE